jgi:hypothetical protein
MNLLELFGIIFLIIIILNIFIAIWAIKTTFFDKKNVEPRQEIVN